MKSHYVVKENKDNPQDVGTSRKPDPNPQSPTRYNSTWLRQMIATTVDVRYIQVIDSITSLGWEFVEAVAAAVAEVLVLEGNSPAAAAADPSNVLARFKKWHMKIWRCSRAALKHRTWLRSRTDKPCSVYFAKIVALSIMGTWVHLPDLHICWQLNAAQCVTLTTQH